MEKEIDLLDKVWSLVREWQGLYGSWKDGAFVDIEVGGPGGAVALASQLIHARGCGARA